MRHEVYNSKLGKLVPPIVCECEASANVLCNQLRDLCGKYYGTSGGWQVRPSKTTLPAVLTPFHTTHPASSAYRVTMSPHEWTWTEEEQIAMAKALVELDGMRQAVKGES